MICGDADFFFRDNYFYYWRVFEFFILLLGYDSPHKFWLINTDNDAKCILLYCQCYLCVCDFFDWFWVNHSRIRVSNIWMVFVLSRWVAILIFIFAVCFFLFITIILKFILNCGFDHSMSKLKLKFCGHKPAEEFMIHINWIYLVLRYFDVCVSRQFTHKLNN